MLQQDLAAHEDQDDPARKLGLRLESQAEHVSDLHARDSENEGSYPDEGNGGNDIHVQEGEGHADCESVNAGRHRKGNHGLYIKGIIFFLFLLLCQRFLYHIRTDQSQKDEGDPVINAGDGVPEARSQEIADQRHTGLKASEVEARKRRVFPAHPLHGKALADRHGKGVHGQAQCDYKKFRQTHFLFPPRWCFFGCVKKRPTCPFGQISLIISSKAR